MFRKSRAISILLVIAMILGILPANLTVAYAAGEVCEVWRGGTLYGSYDDIGVGLSEWLLQANSYSGVALKLLDDVSYEDGISIAGNELNLVELVIDLNGHTFEVNSRDETALAIEYATLTLTGTTGGGAFNLTMTANDPAKTALLVQDATVTVNSVTAKGYASGYGELHRAITADNATITVLEDVVGREEDEEWDYDEVLDDYILIREGGNCMALYVFDTMLNVGGSVHGRMDIQQGSEVTIGGDTICLPPRPDSERKCYIGSDSTLTVGGNLTAMVENLNLDWSDAVNARLVVYNAQVTPYIDVNSASQGYFQIRGAGVNPWGSGGCDIDVYGNAQATIIGDVGWLTAQDEAVVQMTGDAERVQAFGSQITIDGNVVTSFAEDDYSTNRRAVTATYNAVLNISGDVTVSGQMTDSGDGFYAAFAECWDGSPFQPSVKIDGNVTANGAGSIGICATNGAMVEVTGNVSAEGEAVRNGDAYGSNIEAGGSITVNGGVTSGGGDAVRVYADGVTYIEGDVNAPAGAGVHADAPSNTTVNGTIRATTYILFGDSDSRAESGFDEETGGYYVYNYTDGGDTAVVSVLVPGAAAKANIKNTLLTNAQSDKAYADIGDTYLLTLYGEPNGTAAATLTYDDGSGTALSASILTETASGSGLYKGSIALPTDAVALTGLTFTHNAPGKSQAETVFPATNLPEVRGAIEVSLINQYGEGTPITGDLYLYSSRFNAGNGIKVNNAPSVTIKGLPAGTDYRLRMYDSENRLAGELPNITVEAGRETSASLTPELTASLSIQFTFGSDIEKYLWESNLYIYVVDVNNHVTIASSINVRPEGTTRLVGGLFIGHEYKIYLYGENPTAFDALTQQTISGIYDDVISQTVTTVPGDNVVAFHLPDYAVARDATIDGVLSLDDGTLLSNATVTVRQDVPRVNGGNSVVYFYATTDGNGRYSLPVVSGCYTRVSVTRTPAYAVEKPPEQRLTTGNGAHTVDFTLTRVRAFLLEDLPIYIKYLGDTEYTKAFTDWRVASHLWLTIRNNRTGRVSSDYLLYEPGDSFFITIRGSQASLPDATFTLTTDEFGNFENSYYLEQSGVMVNFRTVDTNGIGMRQQYLSCYDNGLAVRDIATNNPFKFTYRKLSADEFQLWIEQPGAYEIAFSQTVNNGKIFDGTATITVNQGQTLSYDLVMTQRGANAANGYISVTPSVAAPGATLTIRADYTRMQTPAGADKLILQVPPGMTYEPGSLTLNNVLISNPTINSNGRFEVSVAASEPEDGYAAFRVTADADIAANRVFTNAVYRTDSAENTLGIAEIKVEALTLNAPEYAARRDIKLSGLAPAGVTVTVYDRGVPLGEAVASSVGIWGMTVLLPGEDGVKYRHELVAQAEYGGDTLFSSRRVLTYDPLRPQLLGIAVYHPDGERRNLDVSGGVVSFPYAYYFGIPNMKVTATFNNPQAVENVVFVLESGWQKQTARATYNSHSREYEAVFVNFQKSFGGANSGLIYVEYDAIDNSATVNSNPPVEEELRNQLPSVFSDFAIDADSIEVTTNPDDGAITASFIYDLPWDDAAEEEMSGFAARGNNPTSGSSGSSTSVSLTVRDLPTAYNTSASEDAFYTKFGYPVCGVRTSMVRLGSDRARITARCVVPNSYLSDPVMGRMAISPNAAKEIIFTVETAIVDGADALYTNSEWQKLLNLQEQIDASCGGGSMPYYQHGLNSLRDELILKQSLSAAMSVASLCLAPATFGLGTVAMWGITWGLGKAMDEHWDNKYNDLAAEVAGDDDCRDEDEDDGDGDGDDGDGGGGGAGGGARPHWILDPSGIVYEVTMDQPLQGVTATALYEVGSDTGSGTGTGVWEVWDAEFYEQFNPYISEYNGYYGWDVPKGNWKVMYELDGYTTAYSDEMEVPPIRTEVNVPLESTNPALPVGAYWTADDAIEIVFDKYIKAADINASNVSVYTAALADDGTALGGNEFLPGTFTALEPVVYKGEIVAKRFRFALDDGAFTQSHEHHVGLTPIINSYAGIPLGFDGDHNYSITITEAPPVPVSGVTLDETMHFLKTGGGSIQAQAEVLPLNAGDKAVIWTTSNASVATVSSSGNITPIATGSCIVTVRTIDGGFEAYANVAVEAAATGVSLDKTAVMLTLGGSYVKLNATVTPSNATNKSLIWTTNNASVATVDQSGRVTPVGLGNCVVTAKTVDGGFTATSSVTVANGVPVTGVTLDQAELYLTPGGAPVQIVSSLAPANASNQTVRWSTCNADIITVDQTGCVTPVGEGTCVVTAATNEGEYKASCIVYVSSNYIGEDPGGDIQVTGIRLNKTSLNLTVGGAEKLTATIEPGDATNRGVVWSVCDTDIVTVDQQGNVTAVGPGTCVVTAKSAENASVFADCVVTVTAASSYVSVTNIIGVPLAATAGTPLALTGTVSPSNATNRTIAWSVKSAGSAGATIIGNTLNTTAEGTVVVTATVINGKTVSTDYTQDFTITINAPSGGDTPGGAPGGSGGTTPDKNAAISVNGMSIAIALSDDGLAMCRPTQEELKKIIEAVKDGDILFCTGNLVGISDVTGIVVELDPARVIDARINSLTLGIYDAGSVSLSARILSKLAALNKILQFKLIKGSLVFDILADGKSIGWYDYEAPILVSLDTADADVVMKNIPRSWVKNWTLYSLAYSTGRYEAVGTAPVSFTDTQGKWMDPAARYMSARGIIAGVGNNLFAPERNVTRAEFVTMLMRALNIEPRGDWRNTSQQFSDVPEGVFYYDALLKAKVLGIVSGIGGNRFDPNATITRQDMFVMLCNAMVKCALIVPNTDAEEPKWLDSFTDGGDIADYARKAMSVFIKEGIVGGKGGGVLDPKGTATRAEAAQIIYNMLLRDMVGAE